MTTRRLLDHYDALLLDLDGVIYLGEAAVPAAAPTMSAVRAWPGVVRFITNNASRNPDQVAAKLSRLGVAAAAAEVITSATCAAAALADSLAPGAAVLVIGGPGIDAALQANGLTPVRSADDQPEAVLQGWAPTVDWAALAEGAIAIGRGARWFTTNLDATIPSERGTLPGNGSMVAALAHAVRRQPEASSGKPEPAMYLAAMPESGRSLAVGDRLDTDILGATRAGVDSLLVLSGVSTTRDVIGAPEDQRPTFVGRDIGAVLEEQPIALRHADGEWSCGAATARMHGDQLKFGGDRGRDGLDRLRLALAVIKAKGQDFVNLESLDL